MLCDAASCGLVRIVTAFIGIHEEPAFGVAVELSKLFWRSSKLSYRY